MLTAGIKQRIKSTYAEYNDGTVELEARFGRLTNRGFIPGVTRQIFNRIRDYFDQRAQAVETKTTDYISQNVRKTVTVPVGDKEPKTIWITKDRLWNQEDKNYGIRYSMSREIPIQPVPDFVPDIIREKSRYSYSVFRDMVRIDITMVDMVQGLQGGFQKDQTRYEVEIELINPLGLVAFDKSLVVTLHRVLDTIVLYNSYEANAIISFTNMLLGSRMRGKLDHYPMVQARNLKLKDMVWGGLIGNQETGYSVTHKADGQRKLLVFHTTGIWLVMSPYSLNRISNTEIPTLTGTILDGEYIPPDKRLAGAPKSLIWYLTFDCLAWNNDNSIQKHPHGKRMNHAQAVTELLKTNLIYINTKTFRNFGTPQEFFTIMRDMFREQEHLSYKQDGFMFTPVNTVYNPHTDTKPLYRRVLTDWVDICKWKPKDQLTIDFKIQWKAGPQGSTIRLYVNEKGKPVLFQGTKIFPYRDKVDHQHRITAGLPNGTIVEYGWDYQRELLIPHRVRHDKTKPNKIDIAEDVWMDIQRPLDQETMEGKSFTLLRAYHNRIKKHIISTSFELSNVTSGLTLLDIGSGRGGDVSKWRKFSKVIAVEPNKEHIVELERRIALNGMTDRVMILNTGGEDIVTIHNAVRQFIGGRVDVVSMMLSMSFFWRSQSMVNRLVNTITSNIKTDGKIIFLTIDGDLVEQTFEPAFDTGPALTRLDLGPATLTYDGDKTPKELYIHIEGTIVEDQTEWLVRLGDLIMPLGKFGFEFYERNRADDEKFLTEEEITMTQMYTSGVIRRNPDITDTVSLPELYQVMPEQETDPGLKTDPTDRPAVSEVGLQPIAVPMISPDEIGIPIIPPIAVPQIDGDIVTTLPPVTELPPLPELPEIPTVTVPTVPPIGTVKPAIPQIPQVGFQIKKVEMELPMIPMDTYEELTVTWYPNEKVVRIGAIGDGSCFFHSVLGAYYPPYQNNPDREYRTNFVSKLRRDIAYTLEMEDPKNPGKTLWETAANGQLAALHQQQVVSSALGEVLDIKDRFGNSLDFSLNGLQRLFNSKSYLGDEVYQYASDMLGIDIYVMRLTNKDLYVHLNTSVKGLVRKVVVISGNGSHYETVGIEREGLFQTVFDQKDPFIKSLRNLIDDIGGTELPPIPK